MRNSIALKLILVTSGLIGLAVGSGILFVPHAFHGSAGIALGNDVNLLNEMRAPGALLIIASIFILSGALKPGLALPAILISTVLYLSFGFSRLISVFLDGMPGAAMIQIMVLEILIGAICLAALKVYRATA